MPYLQKSVRYRNPKESGTEPLSRDYFLLLGVVDAQTGDASDSVEIIIMVE